MKKAMIWGASGDIGKAILLQLKAEGWYIIGLARKPSAIDEIADLAIDARFEDPNQVTQAVTLAAQEVEEINFWIYAAGDILSAKIAETKPADWQRIINANLTGPFLALHSSFPLLSEDAHILFLGAISERLRLPGLSAYAASKTGLEAFAEVVRKENRKKKVTIVRPGAVATKFWEKIPLKLPTHSASPEKVARKIIAAYQEGHTGHLDLV